jgi:hypothetical protein
MGHMIPLVAAMLVAAASPAATPRVVEEIVAVVRNPPGATPRIITLTKLAEEARVALVSRGAAAAATRPLDLEALRAALDWLLDQVLLADEAARLGLDAVEREAVAAALARFRAQLGTADDYARFLSAAELSEEELSSTLARMVRVERYVQSRVGRGTRVGEEELDRWLGQHGAAGASGPAREAARAQLEQERASAQVRELVAELRGRADVRILGPLGKDGR